MATNIGGVII